MYEKPFLLPPLKTDRTFMPLLRTFLHIVFLSLLAMATPGCERVSALDPVPATATDVAAKDTATVMSDSVNYMHTAGVQYTLYDLSKKPPIPVGGAIVYMLASGGEKGCCLTLPKTWKPGMKVRLQWQETDRERTYEENTRELEIPPYDEPADLYVVFYPGKEVELVVSAAEPGHPDWRGRIKQAPWDHCVENHGRKPCKAALPKQFDTRSSQGFCTFTVAEDYPRENFDGELMCWAATQECMKDYEDEEFCKGILWGERKK